MAPETVDPDGIRVVLPEWIWEHKIRIDHPELDPLMAEILQAVTTPDFIEPDPRPTRMRFFRRGVGPTQWLMVVVSYEQTPARIITAYPTRKDPEGWKP